MSKSIIGILPTETTINYCGDEWKDNLFISERENLIMQLNLCYDNDIPILGICVGQNNIARDLGGTTQHTKTIKECPGLEKVAFCEDGYYDIIETKNKTFYIGVRFHPESLYKIDESHNRIFKEFINTCQEKNYEK